MLKIKIISVGALSEPHWKAACAEYKKRLTGNVAVDDVCLKEERLPASPSSSQISSSLEKEADRIIAEIPKRALVIPLCVEGRLMSSEELASKISSSMTEGVGEICFIIGSSYGLSPRVKAAGGLRLSLSPLTFPHQLAKVMLYETVYRTVSIISGSKYHK